MHVAAAVQPQKLARLRGAAGDAHHVHAAAQHDPIASELSDGVVMFTWHNDEVKADHPDMTILASTPLCPNQVWRWRDQPVWGIQGHLEIPLDEPDRMLELLAVVQDTPGSITLRFAAGRAIRLEIGRLACHLGDVGEPWATPWKPAHPVE